jgi:hypothetical protein
LEAAEVMHAVAQAGTAEMEAAQGWGHSGGEVIVDDVEVDDDVEGAGVVVVAVDCAEEDDGEEVEVVEEEGSSHSSSKQVHPWLAGPLKAL